MVTTYRDANLALANEFSMIGETLGVNTRQAIEIANAHPRVDVFTPGIGVGGHCIPVDPWFLTEVNPAHTQLITTARRINDSMPMRITATLREAVADLADPEIVLIGMAYKPETDDLRESPALKVAENLRRDGFHVRQYDPMVNGHGYESLARVAGGADVLAVLVPHKAVVSEVRANGAGIRAA